MSRTIKTANVMAEVAPLPKDFEKWLSKQVFLGRHYMYYSKIGKGQYKGYCTCGGEYDMAKAKSGSHIICPHCKRKVKLKLDKYSSITEEKDYVAYVQKTSYGYLSRLMFVTMTAYYENGKTTERIRTYEKQRDLVEWDGELRQYHIVECYYALGTRGNHWIKGRAPKAFGYNSNVCIEERPLKVYPHNLKNLFEMDRQYKYSQIDTASKHFCFNPVGYMQVYKRYPQLELLVKVGWFKLAEEYFLACDGWYRYAEKINKKAANLCELTGLKQKTDIAYCIKHNFCIGEVKAYLKLKSDGVKISLTLVRFAVEMVTSNHNGFNNNNKMATKSLYSYYLSQKKNYSVIKEFLCDYGDYLRWSRELGRDLSDTKFYKPKDFKYAHDMTLVEYTEFERERREKANKAHKAAEKKRERERQRILKKLAPHYKELLGYSNKGLCIVVPKSGDEIENEGKLQSHCVGGYVNRVANGISVILFLREKANLDMPFYTIELNPLEQFKLVQCRGKSNRSPTPEVNTFIEKWTKVIQQRLAEKNKKTA